MHIVFEQVAGLDVHKKSVVAATLVKDTRGRWHQEKHTFGTMTADLLALSDWLLAQGVTHVAMESTGEYWKPVYNLLEDTFTIFLVNAQHLSRVPGRKTDQSDAEWLAELMQAGLLKASFVPPQGQRPLRELTRARSTFIREKVNLVNRVQKVLESANIKLASVASEVTGVSARDMLAAIIEGQASPEAMAELARGRMKAKRAQLTKALEGRVQAHHRFILTELLSQIDGLDETLAHFDAEIERYCRPFEEAVVLVDTIPGIARQTAEVIVSEVGVDMSRFPTADHLASWAGVAPGNNQSGGQRRSGRVRKGDKPLKVALTQAAQAVGRTKNNYLSAQYHRLARRIGKKKAVMAVAHSILVIVYHLIKTQEPYHDLGSDYFDKRRPEVTAKRLVKRLEQLGYQVALQQPQGAMVA